MTHSFIDRPIFATVLSVFLTLIGLGALAILPISQYPEIVPPTVQITTTYPGASAETVSRTVATPLEQEINGVENMIYMTSQSTGDGKLTDHRDVPDRDRPQRRADADAEPRAGRPAPPARRRATARRPGAESDAQHPAGGASLFARQLPRHALHLELCDAACKGRAGAPARRRRRADRRRPRIRHADLARSRQGRRAQYERERSPCRAARPERPGLGWHPEPAAGRLASRPIRSTCRRSAGSPRRKNSPPSS